MGRTIKLLGKPAIVDGAGAVHTVRGHQAWALLARILLSRRALDRRNLAAELFPDAVDPLGSLRWCLAALRRALGSAQALSGDPIQANLPAGTTVDVLTLHLAAPLPDETGDLLDGVEPKSSPAFSTWLLIERGHTAAVIDQHIRQDILQSISSGRFEAATRRAEVLVRRQPLDEGAHILLVKSLTLAGHQDAALQHVALAERAFRAELGEAPSDALRSAARKTVAAPPGGVSQSALSKSLLESGSAALAAGATDAGIDCLRRAVAAAERGKDRYLQTKGLHELGAALVHSIRGYDDEGAILLRQSVECATETGLPEYVAAGYRELGYIDALAGRRPSAASYLQRAAQTDNDANIRSGICAVDGFNLVDWGRVDTGLAHYEQSLELAREAENPRRQVWALGIGAWGQLAAQDYEKALEWLNACLKIVDELKWVAFRPWAMALVAEARLGLGVAPGDLFDPLDEAFALSCQVGDPCWEAEAARVIAMVHCAVGDFALALDWLEQARIRCRREIDPYAALQVNICADRAEIYLRQGDGTQADGAARELLALAARSHMDRFVDKAVGMLEQTAM
ncbi:MAG: BTAD domain-containing putative transcriptional regulator [Paracoccaceae bacterium]